MRHFLLPVTNVADGVKYWLCSLLNVGHFFSRIVSILVRNLGGPTVAMNLEIAILSTLSTDQNTMLVRFGFTRLFSSR
jgi:hypothetical protein